ncbi:FAD-dependent oxidoreductase [Prochlorococcus sp. MIT 0604]|uniref:FAD-dependent oxidoreductase n=1 Tax=Prochlorococcus sp. MIT 0604 TaxID=1501268 RepID=UPI0004F71CB9|nr:FAD-dependent oxidoreductase [Prochlorococcus sp. MIT 0604]AIQ95570.1 Succinate dehydrogenase flavoprotein subunit [Prochlorococcus sp. MIT 0604]
MPVKDHLTQITNVLVIGCGGAGLRSAIEIKKSGLDVTILGKRPKTDAHTVLAAGGINAALGTLDKEDTWEQHFIDTYLEGYGIGDPLKVEIMAKESPSLVKEIDKWGADFAKLKNGELDQRFFGAHKYRRTCYSGDFTGLSILKTLLKKSDELKIPIYDNQYVTELLIRENTCFGAMSFNLSTSERTVHFADAVVLCTGGHTRLWKKSSSRKNENTGDGYYLGLKAGCELIDMEMVQFHPSGMVSPEEIEGTLVTEAVRGEGGRLINKKGERFMKNYDPKRMELSTRDKVAIANYTEIIEGRGTKNGAVLLDISHKSREFIIEKLPNIYRQFLETQMLDISKSPMEVSPTAHYSMGGILVNPEDLSTSVKGLFAAGEVAGGLHGANRLGGNSLAEILIFGKRAGIASSKYSKRIDQQLRSNETIAFAHENINKFIKNGDELVRPLQHELRLIMWKYCGVIKNETLLREGLSKIETIKTKIDKIDIRIDKHNCEDLALIFDLQSSLISAKATILSALQRNESRGAHQRSDCPSLDPSFKYNCLVRMDENNNLIISKSPLKELNEKLKTIIVSEKREEDIKNKLLE